MRKIYICTTKSKNLSYNSVCKLSTVFLVNDFSIFLITKCFILDVKGFLDSPLYAIHQTQISSQLIILNVFKDKMSRFLQFYCKLNTCRTVKSWPFRFCVIIMVIPCMLCYPSFLNIVYRSMVFLHISPSVSTISLGVSTVSPHCFPRVLFQILRIWFRFVIIITVICIKCCFSVMFCY